MYYEIGEIRTKFITVQGFNFRIKVTKTHLGAFVEMKDSHENVIDTAEIDDNEFGFDIAKEKLEQSIFNWIESNTDESDHIMNRVMKW